MSSTRAVFEQQMNQLAAQLPILGGAQKHTVEYERFRMLSPESSPDSVYFSPKVKTDQTSLLFTARSSSSCNSLPHIDRNHSAGCNYKEILQPRVTRAVRNEENAAIRLSG